jgi:hypothetical protein
MYYAIEIDSSLFRSFGGFSGMSFGIFRGFSRDVFWDSFLDLFPIVSGGPLDVDLSSLFIVGELSHRV